ncbi:MAG: dephospho-CoA kinase [Nitrospinota bacterium]
MVVVGLTGGIASGKSVVAKMLRERGAHLIDADALARKLVEPGEPALEEVVRAFGRGVLNPDGTLNRKALGGRVFQDPGERRRLEAILHPRIWAEEDALIERYRPEDPRGVVVVEAALMVETGSYRRFDLLVVVDCDERQQVERLRERDGLGEEEARARLAAQMPLREKVKLAWRVVDNRGPLARTEGQVEALMAELRRMAAEKRVDNPEAGM